MSSSEILGELKETGDDFLDFLQLRAHFSKPDVVEHRRRVSGRADGSRYKIDIKRWQRVKEIDRGGFGIVWKEEDDRGKFRAVKEIVKPSRSATAIDDLKEILAMGKFTEEECLFVQLFGWFQDERYIFIAMEYLPYGDLQKCVSGPLPEDEARTIAFQLIEALVVMHGKNFSHRDLKPSNVFVAGNGPSWWVKLGDFGVSKRVRGDGTVMHTSIESDYTAPEILGFVGDGSEESSHYTNAVDMWSLGFLVHWLLTGKLPLKRWELNRFCLGISSFPMQYLETEAASREALDLLQKLIIPQPELRIGAKDALGHGWARDLATRAETSFCAYGTAPKVHTLDAARTVSMKYQPSIRALESATAGDCKFENEDGRWTSRNQSDLFSIRKWLDEPTSYDPSSVALSPESILRAMSPLSWMLTASAWTSAVPQSTSTNLMPVQTADPFGEHSRILDF